MSMMRIPKRCCQRFCSFPILSTQVRMVPKLVINCVVLYNITKHLNDAWEVKGGIQNAIDKSEEKVPVTEPNNLDRNKMIFRYCEQQKQTQISNNLTLLN